MRRIYPTVRREKTSCKEGSTGEREGRCVEEEAFSGSASLTLCMYDLMVGRLSPPFRTRNINAFSINSLHPPRSPIQPRPGQPAHSQARCNRVTRAPCDDKPNGCCTRAYLLPGSFRNRSFANAVVLSLFPPRRGDVSELNARMNPRRASLLDYISLSVRKGSALLIFYLPFESN